MITLIHPTGNANVRGVLTGLYRDNMLATYYTTIGYASENRILKMLPHFVTDILNRRSYNIPQNLIINHPYSEIFRLLNSYCCLKNSSPLRVRSAIDNIYYKLDHHLAKDIESDIIPNVTKVIYGYEDGSLNSFKAAKKRGLINIYDLPIGYWRAGHEIFFEEAELQPQWSITIPALNEPENKLVRKDEELALADHIFVASSFTRETLNKAPTIHAQVEVISYGAPPPVSHVPFARAEGKPLRALFVGGLSQRKGISYLFDAIASLKGMMDLTVIGRRPVGCEALDKHLDHHTWIASLPHHHILEIMCQNDVLVFPSLFEGFGLVILEALSQGIPVITTPHTAGPDLLTDGEDGFIVPIRSSEAIAEKLELLYRDCDLLEEMKKNALKKSREYTWQHYRGQLVSSIKSFISNN